MKLLKALWKTIKELEIGDKVCILCALFGVLFVVCCVFKNIIPTIIFGLIFLMSAIFMLYTMLKGDIKDFIEKVKENINKLN